MDTAKVCDGCQRRFLKRLTSRKSSATSSDAELDINTRGTPHKIEPPPNFRALTLLDNILGAKSRPEWQDPVRWCMWGNAAVLILNIIFTIAALGISASSQSSLGFGTITLYHGSCSTTQRMKIGLHLLINILTVTLTATSSYCCTILMAPSRTDIDTAHLKGTWLSIGVSSWRNFRNLKKFQPSVMDATSSHIYPNADGVRMT